MAQGKLFSILVLLLLVSSITIAADDDIPLAYGETKYMCRENGCFSGVELGLIDNQGYTWDTIIDRRIEYWASKGVTYEKQGATESAYRSISAPAVSSGIEVVTEQSGNTRGGPVVTGGGMYGTGQINILDEAPAVATSTPKVITLKLVSTSNIATNVETGERTLPDNLGNQPGDTDFHQQVASSCAGGPCYPEQQATQTALCQQTGSCGPTPAPQTTCNSVTGDCGSVKRSIQGPDLGSIPQVQFNPTDNANSGVSVGVEYNSQYVQVIGDSNNIVSNPGSITSPIEVDKDGSVNHQTGSIAPQKSDYKIQLESIEVSDSIFNGQGNLLTEDGTNGIDYTKLSDGTLVKVQEIDGEKVISFVKEGQELNSYSQNEFEDLYLKETAEGYEVVRYPSSLTFQVGDKTIDMQPDANKPNEYSANINDAIEMRAEVDKEGNIAFRFIEEGFIESKYFTLDELDDVLAQVNPVSSPSVPDRSSVGLEGNQVSVGLNDKEYLFDYDEETGLYKMGEITLDYDTGDFFIPGVEGGINIGDLDKLDEENWAIFQTMLDSEGQLTWEEIASDPSLIDEEAINTVIGADHEVNGFKFVLKEGESGNQFYLEGHEDSYYDSITDTYFINGYELTSEEFKNKSKAEIEELLNSKTKEETEKEPNSVRKILNEILRYSSASNGWMTALRWLDPSLAQQLMSTFNVHIPGPAEALCKGETVSFNESTTIQGGTGKLPTLQLQAIRGEPITRNGNVTYYYKITFKVTGIIDPYANIEDKRYEVEMYGVVNGEKDSIGLSSSSATLSSNTASFAYSGKNAIIDYIDELYSSVCVKFSDPDSILDPKFVGKLNGKEFCTPVVLVIDQWLTYENE